MCAVLLIVARLLRLGFIANFLSRSVLVGFLTGVGIQVAMGQVGGMFGITGRSGGTLEKFAETLPSCASPRPERLSRHPGRVGRRPRHDHLGPGRVNKTIPGALIAVVGVDRRELRARPGRARRDRPGHRSRRPAARSGCRPSSPAADNLETLLPTVISMFVVILAQSAATSRAYAMQVRRQLRRERRPRRPGLANSAAGITGTFVVNGSPTKTEMVDSAGGRSQVAQLTAGAIVVVVLLFLTGPLAYMPNAVLASVVFLIGVRLVDIRGHGVHRPPAPR